MSTLILNPHHFHYRSQSIELVTPPRTPPPKFEDITIRLHNWPEPEDFPEEPYHFDQQTSEDIRDLARIEDALDVVHQEVLLLHAPKQKYALTQEYPIPSLQNEREMLVEVEAIGLNPIDWKAPDFGWGLPSLPCISGRDLAGKVVRLYQPRSRFNIGDSVMAISTDYRDSRKAAYQQFTIVSDFNACRIPPHLTVRQTAPLGVAFVAAALALGICIGLDFSGSPGRPNGPDLLQIVRSLSREALPNDVHAECFEKLERQDRATAGDWIAIWGGSSATGCIATQLAKLAGLRVIAVADIARSGERMLKYGADLLVDRLDTQRAVEVMKGVTGGSLRFGLDTRGKDTADLLARAMTGGGNRQVAHVVGLVGSPKEQIPGVVFHSVPIKVFHEAPQVGEGLMIWLEKLLVQKLVSTPDIEVAEGGLRSVNAALDRLRDGSVNGPRIVVTLKN